MYFMLHILHIINGHINSYVIIMNSNLHRLSNSIIFQVVLDIGLAYIMTLSKKKKTLFLSFLIYKMGQ